MQHTSGPLGAFGPTITVIDDPFLSTNEVAAALKKHPLSIYRYLREDPEFPKPVRVSANRLGWRKSVIEAYVAALESRGYVSRPQRAKGEKVSTKKGAK